MSSAKSRPDCRPVVPYHSSAQKLSAIISLRNRISFLIIEWQLVTIHAKVTYSAICIAAYGDTGGVPWFLAVSSELTTRQLPPGNEHPVSTLMLTVALLSPLEFNA